MSLSPTTRRRQQRWARWARRTPGFELLLLEVLPRIRRSAVLNDLAWRVFAPQHGPGHLAVPLHAGRYLNGPDLPLLPVVGVQATGLSAQEASRLLDAVAALQRRTASFRPVIVLDRPVFDEARRHGFVLEVVIREEEWVGPGAWVDYVSERSASVIEHYQLWHLAVAHGPHLDPSTVALLTRLATRLPTNLRVGPAPVLDEEDDQP